MANDINKPILTSTQLIEHMKAKGIKFNITDETKAQHFLEEHNYFFKLAAYRKNYNKSPLGPNAGKYNNLEFAYLQDLSQIDCHLRYLVLDMCLDLEHALKIMLLKDIENNPKEDSYNIINTWDHTSAIKNKITRYLKTSYCAELIKKYDPQYPVWVISELISFGDLCKLIKHYNDMYPKRLPFSPSMLFPVRDLRNAAAHSNCLIHDVRSIWTQGKPNQNTVKFITSISTISKRVRQAKLANKPIHDFITMLYLYPTIVKSEKLLTCRKNDLKYLLENRMTKNKAYYVKNSAIATSYEFVFKVFQHIKQKY